MSQHFNLELYIEDKFILKEFNSFEEIYHYILSNTGEGYEMIGYIYNTSDEVVCNFHGLKHECLEQINVCNLDLY